MYVPPETWRLSGFASSLSLRVTSILGGMKFEIRRLVVGNRFFYVEFSIYYLAPLFRIEEFRLMMRVVLSQLATQTVGG